MRGTTAPCYSEARGVRVEHIQPSGNLWGRNDQNILILIVGHGGETEENMITVSKKKKEKRKEKRRGRKKGGEEGGERGARLVSYLDFTSFHQRTVKLLSGPLCVCARLERYKTEALRAEERGEWEKRGRGGGK